MPETLTFFNLPKVSMNEWYAGKHWTQRLSLKKKFIKLLEGYHTHFKSTHTYTAHYAFQFKGRALDATNCAAMVKVIEDILFESDSYKVVKQVSITSEKGTTDRVDITVEAILARPKKQL